MQNLHLDWIHGFLADALRSPQHLQWWLGWKLATIVRKSLLNLIWACCISLPAEIAKAWRTFINLHGYLFTGRFFSAERNMWQIVRAWTNRKKPFCVGCLKATQVSTSAAYTTFAVADSSDPMSLRSNHHDKPTIELVSLDWIHSKPLTFLL